MDLTDDYRRYSRRVLATLIRVVGDFDLAELQPVPEVFGLLALMLLHDARRLARQDKTAMGNW